MVLATSPHRLAFIDSLRGFAALYVLLFHLVFIPSPQLNCPAWLKPFIINGGTGVTLFFVVSAFTLCFTLEAREGEQKRTMAFYLRRIFRIVPLYYFWLMVMALMQYGPEVIHYKRQLLLYGFFGYNFFPAFQEGLVWASWTLGVEMVFYLFFPLIFYFVNSIFKAMVFLCLSLVIAWFHFHYVQSSVNPEIDKVKFIHFHFLHQLPVFAVGILAYFIYRKLAEQRRPVLMRWLLAIGIAGICFLPYVPIKFIPFPMIYLMAPTYAALLLGLSAISPFVLVNKITIFFGAISYSLYLNHPQLIYRSQKLYQWIYSKDLNPFVQLGICFGMALAMVTAISCLTYLLIEQPGIKCGSRLIKRLRSGSYPAQPKPVVT